MSLANALLNCNRSTDGIARGCANELQNAVNCSSTKGLERSMNVRPDAGKRAAFSRGHADEAVVDGTIRPVEGNEQPIFWGAGDCEFHLIENQGLKYDEWRNRKGLATTVGRVDPQPFVDVCFSVVLLHTSTDHESIRFGVSPDCVHQVRWNLGQQASRPVAYVVDVNNAQPT